MEGNGDVARATPGIAARRPRAAAWPGAMAGAFLAALGRPRWWALALAAFLLRGGIVLVILPMLVPPTVASLTTLAAPTIAAVAFGNPPPGMVEAYAIGGALLAAWLVVAVVVGAWLELALVDAAARDERELAPRELAKPIWRAAVVRLLAHAATVVVAAYAIVRIVVETYSELLAPGDQAIALVWRIVARAPDAIMLFLGSWLVGEAVGGFAVRRVAAGDTVGQALFRALRELVRPSGVATLLLTTAGVAAMVLPLWLATARTWDQLRALLVDDGAAPLVVVSLLMLVAAWGLGLALLGAGLAWRSAAWTAEAYGSSVGEAGVPEPTSAADAAGEPLHA